MWSDTESHLFVLFPGMTHLLAPFLWRRRALPSVFTLSCLTYLHFSCREEM